MDNMKIAVVHGDTWNLIIKCFDEVLGGYEEEKNPGIVVKFAPRMVKLKSLRDKLAAAPDGAVVELTDPNEIKDMLTIGKMVKAEQEGKGPMVLIEERILDADRNADFGSPGWKDNLRAAVKIAEEVPEADKMAIAMLLKDIDSSPETKLVFSGEASRTMYIHLTMALISVNMEASLAKPN